MAAQKGGRGKLVWVLGRVVLKEVVVETAGSGRSDYGVSQGTEFVKLFAEFVRFQGEI